PGGMTMRSIGVDLHSNSLTACYLSQAGAEQLATWGLSDLTKFLATLRPDDQVAVEATGNTRWFSQQLQPHVRRVVIVDPNQFEVIRRSVRKTDKHDARALAQFLQKDLLPGARLRSELAAEITSLAETRDKLHALHRGRGVPSRKSEFLSEKGLRRALERDWGVTTRVEVEVIVSQLRA